MESAQFRQVTKAYLAQYDDSDEWLKLQQALFRIENIVLNKHMDYRKLVQTKYLVQQGRWSELHIDENKCVNNLLERLHNTTASMS